VAKVVDFGLVKDLEDEGGLSHEAALVGTPHYLAPETIRSPGADARSDLYAVGAVAYFLLTGQHVFEGRTVIEICGHHLHTTPVPPSDRLGRALPEALEAWVLACLAKDPARRPQTAALAVAALERCAVPSWTEDDARAVTAPGASTTSTTVARPTSPVSIPDASSPEQPASARAAAEATARAAPSRRAGAGLVQTSTGIRAEGITNSS
jgi:serine/threonine protein kinase